MYNRPYNENGLLIMECPSSDFSIKYWDKPKNQIDSENAINGGFFASFVETVNGRKVNFTMPVANICCDHGGNIPEISIKYIKEWTKNTGYNDFKIAMTSSQNSYKQFKDKQVSTIMIHNNNDVEFDEVSSLPLKCKYALSGIPVIRNSECVDWIKFAAPQGWGDNLSFIDVGYRNFIGHKGTKIYIIADKTVSSNFVYHLDTYRKIQHLGLEDVIAIDGGGSFIFRGNGNTLLRTNENKRINNICVIQ